MDDIKCRALFCEAIVLLKEIAESRGQFYSEEEQLNNMMKIERYYTPQELLSFGLVDEIY